MKNYLYETHLHTKPVSRCALSEVEELLKLYKNLGYDGVFITNHFLDGNVNIDDKTTPYEQQIEFYFSDYEKGLALGKEMGLKVFFGAELSYKGTDFLVYGLDKSWFLAHPEIMKMKKSEELALMREAGAFIVQAHPFREASYIDHIRLFPRHVDGVEVINASQQDLKNELAAFYAERLELIPFAGSDTHGKYKKILAGIKTQRPVEDERDFINLVRQGQAELFKMENPYAK